MRVITCKIVKGVIYSNKSNEVMVIAMNNDELSKLLNDYFEAYQNTTKIMMDLVAWPLSQNKLSFEQFLILRQVKSLLMQHYVFQVPDPRDRRRLYLHLTERGQQVERVVDQAITQHFDHWVNQLGAPQIDQVLQMMETFSQQVTDLGEPQSHPVLH